MANVIYLTGVAHWAKVLGKPVANYNKDGFEWTMDFTPDKDGLAQLKALGLGKKIKNKDDARGDFLQIKQKEKKANGENNRPIPVFDAANRHWNQNTKIGNGSLVEVKLDIVKYPAQIGVYCQGIRVLELVEYARQEFPDRPDDDEYVAKADVFNPVVEDEAEPDAELDDDVPDFVEED